MDPKEIKKQLINAIKPEFNKPAGEIEWKYSQDEENKITIICTMGNRMIAGCRLEQHDEKFDGLALLLCEFRGGMPIMEVGYRITDNKIIPGEVDTLLHFPIDEDDEAEVLKEFQDLIPKLDLDKIYYDKPE